MTNIWEFLLQILAVSLVAGLIWVIKWILEDKLSPRWQYGVWSILALRILLPVQSARYIFPKLALWIETLKGSAEQTLNSAFTEIYTTLKPDHVFPWITEKPVSVTDWLFAIYTAGVLLFLLRYLISYLQLRHLLHKGTPADAGLQERIDGLCQKHGLKSCRAVVMDGLESAFVCGIFRPILAIPSNEIDEKILLHELLHLKYKDVLQGIFWSILRALHWCNPWMHIVFDRIGNDMESLCDQRVLERLEGEERREYGVILLNMANRRYARTPGTSSISNGGRNIARRIAAIVRFKKYPQGMALVSVCIIVLMLFPAITGQAASFGEEYYTPDTASELSRSMAAARITRCTTAAGAIDTYAKGLLTGNGLYIATVSPLADHEAIEKEMRSKDETLFYLEDFSLIGKVSTDYGYTILDLIPQPDGSYLGNLAFRCFDEGDSKTLLVPFYAYQQDGWVVEKSGEQQILDINRDGASQQLNVGSPRKFTAVGEYGTVTTYLRITASVLQKSDDDLVNIFGMTSISTKLQPDAEFGNVYQEFQTIYQCAGTPQEVVSVQVIPDHELDNNTELPDLSPDHSGSNGSGVHWGSESTLNGWDGRLEFGGGCGYSNYDPHDLPNPQSYTAHIYWDNDIVEELTLKEVLP